MKEKPLECPIIAGFPANSINERGFGNVPTRVMDDVRLSIGARCLYSLLAAHAGSQHEAWPSVKRIIATLGCSENSFYKYRQELADLGYMSIETRNTRYGRRTVYVMEQIVPYASSANHDDEMEFSTIPSSEPYLKNCGMASETDCEDGGKWKTAGGKPSHTSKFEGTHTSDFEVQNINTGIKTKNSTTSTESSSQLEQGGTACAEPVVAAASAAGSKGEEEIEGKNGEEPLDRDPIDAAFAALEARSLRRTRAASSLDDAKESYRRLVNEGHSPEEISDVYDHYVRWTKANMVRNIMGLATWFKDHNGWQLNYNSLMAKRAAAEKQASARASNAAPQAQAGTQADADYRKRSAAVKRALPDSEAESAYVLAYAESSDDQHLRDMVAFIRSEKPATLSNGYVDDRLCMRPSYDVLSRLVHSRNHIRTYTEKTYSALAAEGKARW